MIDLRTTSAGQLMSPELVSIDVDAPLQSAAEMMSERRIRCLIVDLEEPGRSRGIITAKDIVQLLGSIDPRALEEVAVRDVMTCPAISVQRDLCILDCVNLMLMSGVRRVVVLEGSTPVGVLSYIDVLDAVAGNRAV